MPDQKLVDDCVHCGFCLPACPTYQSWGQEMDSPRGRIYLMKQGKMSDAVVSHFDRCLGCMGCLTACPSGVKYDLLIEQTRAEVELRHRRPWRQRWWRKLIFALFPWPRRLRALLPFQLLAQKLGARRLPGSAGKLAALMPPLSWRHVTARLPESTPAVGPRRARVALLAGCVQRVYFPGVNEATLRVLAAEGVETVVPRGLGCCGALSLHAGRADEADRLRDRAIAALRGYDAVVVNAAGCGSWMKQWRDVVPVKDVHELLVELGPVAARRPLPLRAAYHDACHLAHAQGIRAQPRQLLRAIPDLELVEIPDGDQCCGSAGVYNLLQPESAREIGLRKVENVLATGARTIVSGNPGCTLQISMLLRERGVELETAHPVELLARSIG